MEISRLPVELQNKIFYFLAHPVADMFRRIFYLARRFSSQDVENAVAYFLLITIDGQMLRCTSSGSDST